MTYKICYWDDTTQNQCERDANSDEIAEIEERKAALDSTQAAIIRAERNQRISEVDWAVLGDAPTNKAEYASYRQALRDVPKQEGFPWSITWPQPPQ